MVHATGSGELDRKLGDGIPPGILITVESRGDSDQTRNIG